MTVIRIEIKKILTERVYALRQSTPATFSSQYLVQTDASFPSPQLTAYARSIAKAESRLYPTCVSFESAVVRLATRGATAQGLRGQYSNVSLEKLAGQMVVPEDDALAFPPVTAVYVRESSYGYRGRLLLPHALTAGEWNLYTQKEVVPARFQRSARHQKPSSLFSHELIEAVRGANGAYVLSGAADASNEPLRQIDDFYFEGFRVNPFKPKRKKAKATRIEPTERAAKTKPSVPGFVYLIQSGPHFKIGKSINPNKRFDQIKLQQPHPIKVIHVIKASDSLAAEAHWHRHFKSLRLNGEWFELSPANVEEFIKVSEM